MIPPLKLPQRLKRTASLVKWRFWALAAITGVGLVVRAPHISFTSWDYQTFLECWYDALAHHGFSSFAHNFSDYTPPYLYLLYFITKFSFIPGIPKIAAIKSINIVFDLMSAGLSHELVRDRKPDGWAPVGAFAAAFLSPLAVLIGSRWGQCDSVVTALLLAFLLAASREQWTVASLMYGLALSVKLHALFIAPVFLALMIKGAIDFRRACLVPAVYVLTNIPAWLAGRSIRALLGIYVNQTRLYPRLSVNAPNLFEWWGPLPESWGLPVGLVLAGAACVWLAVVASRRVGLRSPALLVLLATASSLIIPFLLPRMHERYFFEACAFSLVLAFFSPRNGWIAAVMQFSTIFACSKALGWGRPIPIGLLAVPVADCAGFMAWQVWNSRVPAVPAMGHNK